MSDRARLAALPKAHLHLHLESSVRADTLGELAAARGIRLPDVRTFDGFAAFAEHNAIVRECLLHPDDFARIARELCADEAAQGVRHVEVTVTAAAHGERFGHPEQPLEAVLQGLAEGAAAHDVGYRVILDHSRRRSLDRAWQTLELARRYAGYGVVGIGLAGEETYPLAPFARVCDAARDAGVHLLHHAGEAAGADSVREALRIGHTERLGHGIHVLDDPELVAEVRDRRIPLEVCPSSNVALGFAASYTAHPLPRLRDAGLAVTLNADIPAAVGTSVLDEYARARAAFGYDDAVLAELARTSFAASYASRATRKRAAADIDGWLATAVR